MFIRQKIAKSFHPGEMLREKLEELDMPVKEFSLRCNKPEATIHAVLNGTSSVTSDMALLFEKVLGIPALMWLNLQSRYDEYNSRQQLEEELEASRDWVARFPFSEMVSKGYIEAPKPCSLIEKTLVLLTFMGFAKPSAWEKYYQHQALPADFRLSLAGIPEAHALSAWLRYGEIKAREQSDIHPFDASILRSQIEKMKYLANQGKQDFLPNLISLCNEAGVILVCTPHLRKSMARGATRWIKLNPLVQVSDSYKRYDIFWFSFFHELGHILLHGKRDTFLEGVEYTQQNQKKEKEADDFASNCLIPESAAKQLTKLNYTLPDIKSFCKKEQIHLAFVIGRLQHWKCIPHSVGNQYIPRLNFAVSS